MVTETKTPWRPDNWPKNPCIDCPNKQEDIYGLICDLACGKHTAWLNFEAGADAMLEGIKDKLGIAENMEDYWKHQNSGAE